ncbi:hypothetical protein C8J57DRAFT_1719808 [Mycena rebaudengoi]|nr:hypothetical protein C8J57DRAFT_1719808 [Mycena rebaudengoi]
MKACATVPGFVEFAFMGTRFSVFVFVTSDRVSNVSGIVQIDGINSPYQYTRPSLDAFHSPAYTSPPLTNGIHTIRMGLDPAFSYFDFYTYTSDPNSDPSVVERLETSKTPKPTNTAETSEKPDPTNTPPPLPSKAKAKAPVGAIAGGVISGVVFISLALVALFFFLCRRRHSPLLKSIEDQIPPFSSDKVMTSYAGVPKKVVLEEGPDPDPKPKTDPAVLTPLDPAALGEQMRRLNAKVERLEVERIEEASGSTTSPGGSSLGCSLSMIKAGAAISQ